MADDPDNNHRPRNTIESLRLDIESAKLGKTWLLLPEGFRDMDSGDSYPIPNVMEDLQQLVLIPLKPRKRDCGTKYLKRCIVAYKKKIVGKQGLAVSMEYRENRARDTHRHFVGKINAMELEAKEALASVQREAEKAIASMHDLFALGRKGIEGQMKAHLAHEAWQGEEITAKAFRECFRMVTQTVHSLGLPSDESRKAREAIMDELAASLNATREVMEFGPEEPEDKETQH